MSATLPPAAETALRDAEPTFREHPDKLFVLEGHTDSIGAAEFNRRLSYRRAESAFRFLTEELGLPPEQFVVRGFGLERPVAPNDEPEGRALNRRVEISAVQGAGEGGDIVDQYRTRPLVSIDGVPAAIDPRGRFSAPKAAGSNLVEGQKLDCSQSQPKPKHSSHP